MLSPGTVPGTRAANWHILLPLLQISRQSFDKVPEKLTNWMYMSSASHFFCMYNNENAITMLSSTFKIDAI